MLYINEYLEYLKHSLIEGKFINFDNLRIGHQQYSEEQVFGSILCFL